MARPIATINGKPIYSNKRVASIVNNRVTFTDGSWCDVRTGAVVNNGPGYINIGAPPAGDTQDKITKTFANNSRNVDLSDLNADVDVQVHEGLGMEVTIVGPAAKVEAIRLTEEDDTLFISGDTQDSSGSGVTIFSGGGRNVTRIGHISSGVVIGGASISIGGMQFVTDGSGSESDTKITVKVQRGASVSLSGINGHTKVGDTHGALQVNAHGGNDVEAGRVGDANLNLQGSGNISVEEVTDALNINLQGSGDINVANGSVSTLVINLQGSGDAKFYGRARSALLTLQGSGDIRVSNVENRPTRRIMGTGSIRVDNWR